MKVKRIFVIIFLMVIVVYIICNVFLVFEMYIVYIEREKIRNNYEIMYIVY